MEGLLRPDLCDFTRPAHADMTQHLLAEADVFAQSDSKDLSSPVLKVAPVTTGSLSQQQRITHLRLTARRSAGAS